MSGLNLEGEPRPQPQYVHTTVIIYTRFSILGTCIKHMWTTQLTHIRTYSKDV